MMSLKRVEPIQELSHRQELALTFIAWCIQRHRRSPLQKEIAMAIGIKGQSAWLYTEPLIKKGFLSKIGSREKRSLRLTPLAYEILDSDDLKKWDFWWNEQSQKELSISIKQVNDRSK
jgi:predicted transcriptional regulator